MDVQNVLRKLPTWLISVSMIVFIIVVLERLYIAKVSVDIWGLKLNQSYVTMPTEPIIASGDTGKGTTIWTPYQTGIVVKVDTSDAKFKSTPHYVASLHGDGFHWKTTGGSEIYFANRNGFSVYVRFSDGRVLRPETANEQQWHIVWHAVEAN